MESEFKGTPGPWRIDDECETFRHVASDNYHQIKGGVGFYSQKEGVGFGISGILSTSDARLLAAAPELLEALQKILSKAYKQNWNEQYPEELQLAQQAINKALGK